MIRPSVSAKHIKHMQCKNPLGTCATKLIPKPTYMLGGEYDGDLRGEEIVAKLYNYINSSLRLVNKRLDGKSQSMDGKLTW